MTTKHHTHRTPKAFKSCRASFYGNCLRKAIKEINKEIKAKNIVSKGKELAEELKKLTVTNQHDR